MTADTMTAPAGDLSDWFGPKRSPEEKAVDRLRDILSCEGRPPVWSGRPNLHGMMPWAEVVCILAGIDPEGSGDAAEGFFSFLPGALDFYGIDVEDARRGGSPIAMLVAEYIDIVAGMELRTCRPRVAIKAAMDVGLPPPWWAWARADAVCAPFLSDVAEAAQRPSARQEARSFQSRGGEATALKNNPRRDEQKAFALDLIHRNPSLMFEAFFQGLEGEFGAGLSESGWRKHLTRLRKQLAEERKAKSKTTR